MREEYHCSATDPAWREMRAAMTPPPPHPPLRMSWTDLLLWGTVDWDTQHQSCSWLHSTCPGGYRCRLPLCGSCCPPVQQALCLYGNTMNVIFSTDRAVWWCFVIIIVVLHTYYCCIACLLLYYFCITFLLLLYYILIIVVLHTY